MMQHSIPMHNNRQFQHIPIGSQQYSLQTTYPRLIIIMQLKDPNHNFRIRALNRNLSNASSLARSQSLGERKLSLTHHFQIQAKKMDYLKVPTTNSPIFSSTKKDKKDRQKDSKRIILKKLHLSPGPTTIKQIPDIQSKVFIDEPIFFTYSFNRVSYKELIRRENQNEDEEEVEKKGRERPDTSFGFWPKEGKIVLIKQIRTPPNNNIIEKSVSSLNHKGIVEYFGVEIIKDKTLFFSQHVGCGNLQEFVQDFRKNASVPFNETLIRKLTRQLVEIVKYMHEMGYVHGNIRSSKILMTENGEIKLSLVSSMSDEVIDSNSNIKKILWNSPERVLKQVAGKPGDVWGIGMVVLYLATKKKPWCFRAYDIFKNSEQWLKLVQKYQTPNLPLDRSDELVEFLGMCLKFRPEERCTVEQLSESRFLNLGLTVDQSCNVSRT